MNTQNYIETLKAQYEADMQWACNLMQAQTHAVDGDAITVTHIDNDGLALVEYASTKTFRESGFKVPRPA